MIQSPNEPTEPAITLRDYFDAKFGALSDHVDEKFNALRDHVDTQFAARDRESALSYPNRGEYAKLEAKVAGLETMWAKLEGKASQSAANIAMAIAVLGLFISAAGFFWKG